VNKDKKKILIFSEYYLPGYKSGGGMRTIVNIVSHFKNTFDFFIVTKDCDGKGDKTPYEGVDYEHWNDVQGAKVFYLNDKNIKLNKIVELIDEVKPDLLYSNSYFSAFNRYLLIINGLNKFKDMPFIIAPCGELSNEPIKLGKFKKHTYLNLAKSLNFHKNIIWKASSEVEKSEMAQVLGSKSKILVAPDMVPDFDFEESGDNKKPEKIIGEAKMVFLSRLNRKKNFNFLLENIGQITGNLTIDVIGPVDDENYWNECLVLIKKLPSNIKINVIGSIPHSEVIETLKKYHYFVLPTQNENFGHIFLEALQAGCPLIISNRTPWLDLEKKKVGWSLPLEKKIWSGIIQKCVDMDEKEYKILSGNAFSFVKKWVSENNIESDTLNLFNVALGVTLSKSA